MKKYHLFTAALSFAAVTGLYAQYGTRGFLHNTSGNIACITAAKKMNINYNGYVWAGPYPTATGSQADFAVEKVNTSSWCWGCMWSTPYFSRDYNIICDVNCASPVNMPSPHKVTGIDVMEVPPASAANEEVALAGVFGKGVFYAALNSSGGVTAMQYWPIAQGAFLGKPSICRSSNIQYYYITGSYGTGSYVVKVRYDGAVQWSKFYNAFQILEANDIIESPYNSNELIVVGKCQYDVFLAHDAFFMVLNSSNGAVVNFTSYNDGNTGDEYFSSIEPAASTAGGPGYILGGHVSSQYTPMLGHRAWMAKLDPAGGVIWSSAMSHQYQGVTDVIERYNPLTTPARYEYYGVGADYPAANSKGLIVWKLDENGAPSIFPNVFKYGLGSTVAGFTDLTNPQIEGDGNGMGPEDGFAAWGTELAGLPGSRFQISRAYYNGVNGCETISDMTVVNGPSLWGHPAVTTSNFVSTCLYFMLNPSIPNHQYNYSCNWSSSVSGGDNSRLGGSTGLIESSPAADQLSVFPNPSDGVVGIDLGSYTGPVRIKLMNAMGQLVKNVEISEGQVQNGKVRMSFEDMKLSEGLYLMDITIQNQTHTKKVIYQK